MLAPVRDVAGEVVVIKMLLVGSGPLVVRGTGSWCRVPVATIRDKGSDQERRMANPLLLAWQRYAGLLHCPMQIEDKRRACRGQVEFCALFSTGACFASETLQVYQTRGISRPLLSSSFL